MTLDDRQYELLADLATQPAYRLLMDMLLKHEAFIMEGLAAAKGEDELVRIGRFFQVFRTIREFLEHEPQLADAKLKELSRLQGIAEVDPSLLHPDIIHQLRFGHTAPDLEQ